MFLIFALQENWDANKILYFSEAEILGFGIFGSSWLCPL
jgi:hypothetical protein